MAERDWLNQNNFIAYPMVRRNDLSFSGGGELPRTGIVDAGFLLGIGAGFVAGDHEVHLYGVEREAAALKLDFRSNATSMGAHRWLFDIPDTTLRNCTVRTVAETIVGGIPAPDKGDGFVAVGDLSDLRALAAGTHLMAVPLPVEPALLQSLAATFARGISVANDARRCPEPNCGSSLSSSSLFGDADTFPFVLNLEGDIKFREGNNLSVKVNAEANALQLNARIGQGAGPTCEDVIIDEEGFRRGEECTDCDGFIGSINGVAMGKSVKLAVGPGVSVIRFPSLNKIEVKVEINRACES